MIQNASDTEWDEMYEVFNMGHRFEIYLKSDFAGEVIEIASRYGIEPVLSERLKIRQVKNLLLCHLMEHLFINKNFNL